MQCMGKSGNSGNIDLGNGYEAAGVEKKARCKLLAMLQLRPSQSLKLVVIC